MAQRGAMLRHDARSGGLIRVSDPGCNATSCGGSRVGCIPKFRRRHACHCKLLHLCYPYGVPLGLGDGCGLTAGEEPHPVKPLPAF